MPPLKLSVVTDAPVVAPRITTSITAVTPEMARRWLAENNSHNRRLLPARIQEYANDMEAGRWQFNGEAIQFDKFGTLINGQHRLAAIELTGKSQTFLIVRGLEPLTQVTIDQGTRRSPADQMQIAGIPVDATTAAAIRIVIQWETGLFFGDQSKKRIGSSQLVEWAQLHPDRLALLHDLTTAGVRKVLGVRGSLSLAVALRLAEVDEQDALTFFGALVSGAIPKNGKTILVLRERFLRIRDAKQSLSDREIIGLYVLAWNAYRDGRELTKLQRPRTTETAGITARWTRDNFPEPR